MEQLRSFIELAPKLADDRLYEIQMAVTRHPVVGVGRFRQGFLTEEIRSDIEEYIRHFTRSGVLVQDEERGVPSYTGGTHRFQDTSATLREHPFEIGMDRVGENVLGLRPCGIHINQHCMIFVVRDILVRPELVKEYNEENQRIGFHAKLWTPQTPLSGFEE